MPLLCSVAEEGAITHCSDSPSRAALAAPHHHFTVDGESYFFASESLHVLRGTPLTQAIMRRAGSDAFTGSPEPVFDGEELAAQTERLHELGFLRYPGEATAEPDVESGAAVTFMINVSQRCNLTCSYCYVNEGQFDYPERPIKRMKRETFGALVPRIFALFPNLQSYSFHYYGGEPLMNFPAIETISCAAVEHARAREVEVHFYITTNGTLIDDKIADFFDRLRFNVYFSIDGDKETHDQYRKYRDGRGSFDDVIRNFRLLRARPHVHMIGSSVVRDGFSLGEAIGFLAQQGADSCKAERVRLNDGVAGALSERGRERYLRDTRDLIRHYVEEISVGRMPMDYRLTPKILQLLLRKRRNFFCLAGERMFGIAANGEIYPCALHVGRAQGLLGSLADGVNAELAKDFRRRFSADTQPRCGECWARNLCGGGCSAMVDRFGHDDCEALRAEAEAAIVVYAYFAESDPLQLLALVDPRIVSWMNDANERGDE